jgi:hypothetical protein
VGGAGPNPFFELVFSTPYTYTGGNLLVTIGHSAQPVSISVDANRLATEPAGLTDTLANFGSSNATTGLEGFYNSPVAAFYTGSVAPIPEPSTAIVAVFGAVAFAAYGRSRHRRQPRRHGAA